MGKMTSHKLWTIKNETTSQIGDDHGIYQGIINDDSYIVTID